MGLDAEPTCHGKVADGCSEADVTDVVELDSQGSDLRPIEAMGATCPTIFQQWTSTGAGAPLFPSYQGFNLVTDLSGGCVLAMVVIAQGLAAGSVANVSVVAGVYSGIVPALVYGLIGSSRHASVGGGALVSMVVAEEVSSVEGLEARTRTAGVLAVLAGLILCGMGASGLGFLVRFISRPALKGLISASGLLLVFGQTKKLVGISGSLTWSMQTLRDMHPGTFLLSCVLICLILLLGRLKGKAGFLGLLATFKELLAIVVGTGLASLMNRLYEEPIALLGDVPTGLPQLTWPLSDMGLAEITALLPGAFALAITSFVTSFAGSKSIALSLSYEISATRELLGLGLASSLGGCTGGIAIMASLNRSSLAATMVNSQFGAGLVVAVVAALCMAFLAPALRVLPTCAIACLIVTSSYPLVDFKKPLQLYRMHESWSERKDFFAWVAAFILTLWQGIVIGVVVAVSLSVTLLVYDVMHPAVHVLGRTSDGLWVRLHNKYAQGTEIPGVLVVRVDGPLFFANAEYFQEHVLGFLAETTDRAEAPVEKLIVEASKVTFLDDTSLEVLKETSEALRGRGVSMAIVEVPVRAHCMLRHTVPELHPAAERGFRVTVNEVLGLDPSSKA